MRYCPQCGKRLKDTNSRYCSICGAKLNGSNSIYNNDQILWKKPTHQELPYTATSIMSLNDVAGTLALILGLFFLLIGIFTLIFLVGIVFIAFAFVNFIIRWKLQEINTLIRDKKFLQAKNEQLVWTIFGFLIGGILIGVILIIAYTKYEELSRTHH